MMKKVFHSKSAFEHFGIMIDCSRSGVMNVASIKPVSYTHLTLPTKA